MAVVGLSVSGGRLYLGGQRFRNIGVKYPDALIGFFYQPATSTAGTCIYATPAQQDAAIAYLQSIGVKVILCAAYPFYPLQWTSGVLNGKAWNIANAADRAAHYTQMDAMLAKYKAAGIGVILSHFFRFPTIPDLVGEGVRQWLNGGSNTRAFATTIVNEIVTRYTSGARADLADAVYGWQCMGELNHFIDCPTPAGTSGYGINTPYGTAATYTAATDTLYSSGGTYGTSDAATIMAWWDNLVTAIDPVRLRLSGNGPCTYWQPSGALGITNPFDRLLREAVRDSGGNAVEQHYYGGIGYCSYNNRGFDSYLAAWRSAAAAGGRAFVLGEYGNQPRNITGMTVSGGIGTVTADANWASEVGDTFRIVGTPAFDGDWTLTALPGGQNAAATISAKFSAPNGTIGTVGCIQQLMSQFGRMTDEIVSSGTDLSLMWCYTHDIAVHRLWSLTDPANAWQTPVLQAANVRLAAAKW